MRVLYGIVGEGMGHATRSRVILEHLLASGHDVRVVVSGRAHKFLVERFRGRSGIAIDEIEGLNLRFEGNGLDVSESILSNLDKVPRAVVKNVDVMKTALAGYEPQVVVSDFESVAYVYGRLTGTPVLSIDNMQVINRCRHDSFVTDDESFSFQLARLAVKAKLPGAWHYLVSSFFFPPVRKPRTTLVPPILRPEILQARREPNAHVLVYQTASTNTALIPLLQKLPQEFKVYGMGRSGKEKNVELCAFSETGFVDDLRRARAVIAGGGYSLMGEAVHLHVPMFSVPIRGQYEQELNARYLQKLGFGMYSEELALDLVAQFLDRTDEMSQALERYLPRDNSLLFSCVDECLRAVSLDEPPPQRLCTPALGAWDGPDLPPPLLEALENDEDETAPGGYPSRVQ